MGEWVKFPTTPEKLQEVFERIGIGSADDFGNPYEEWFITDYDCYVDGLYNLLGEYENLDELNYLASKLEELGESEYEHFQAAMEISDYTGSKAVDLKSFGKDSELREYLGKILPEYDRDRVYTNDIKKLFTWYNELIAANITKFKDDEIAEDKAAEAAEKADEENA